MNDYHKSVAQRCLDCAENGSMSFPEIIGTLIQEGFESYHVDFFRSSATYYMSDGSSIELPVHCGDTGISTVFDAGEVRSAIREAQQLTEGYTYKGFCKKVMAAGCVGYFVSLTGKRVIYFGRSGENHAEHFPRSGS